MSESHDIGTLAVVQVSRCFDICFSLKIFITWIA